MSQSVTVRQERAPEMMCPTAYHQPFLHGGAKVHCAQNEMPPAGAFKGSSAASLKL